MIRLDTHVHSRTVIAPSRFDRITVHTNIMDGATFQMYHSDDPEDYATLFLGAEDARKLLIDLDKIVNFDDGTYAFYTLSEYTTCHACRVAKPASTMMIHHKHRDYCLHCAADGQHMSIYVFTQAIHDLVKERT